MKTSVNGHRRTADPLLQLQRDIGALKRDIAGFATQGAGAAAEKTGAAVSAAVEHAKEKYETAHTGLSKVAGSRPLTTVFASLAIGAIASLVVGAMCRGNDE